MKKVYKEFFDKINLIDKAELIRIRADEIYIKNSNITKLKGFQQSNAEFLECKISTKVLTAMINMEYLKFGLTDLTLELSRELDKRIIREQRLKLNQFRRIV